MVVLSNNETGYSSEEENCSGSQKFVFRGDMENPWFVAWVHVGQ